MRCGAGMGRLYQSIGVTQRPKIGHFGPNLKQSLLCPTEAYAGMGIASILVAQCRSWVIFVGSTRFRRSRHVRFAPIASEP